MRFIVKFLIFSYLIVLAIASSPSLMSKYALKSAKSIRNRRDMDLTLSADHNDRHKETELALEAIADLWRSKDGRTKVDGSAKVLHRSNSLQTGNSQYTARLHVHRQYKKK